MTEVLDLVPQSNKKSSKKKVWLAVLFSILLPGFGYVYTGETKRGLLFFSSIYAVIFIFGFFRWTTFFYGWLSMFLLLFLMQVYFLMDAILSVKRVQYFEPSFFRFKYSRHVLFVGMFVFSFMIDINAVLGIQSFNIPYNSNMPIIEAGDFVVADLRAYERRRPDYGDLVVFYLANQTFCYRVVGIPNDHVRLEKNSLIINSKRCEEHFLKDTMVQGLPLSLYEETLPNGRKHLIYKDKTRFDSSMANTPNCFVYTDNYYLLGDHRDYAMDSRMFGMIKQTQIIGQLVFSIWGEHGIERANISLK